ncbi:amidohydrolase family protein [Sporosarcina ureilytica]|uniref:Amidohydrolase 3 domain-containing protein n=1 Tax=Sporosarcina ureilytica TaxID=298596 RepID=A0A1D8JCL3_9BACL|nr:amidohydrolase family protein [Sporosarcina ureilytica]AOV06442.1 hypothetical protein BI350_01675 [Sporosarcina ureilytica]
MAFSAPYCNKRARFFNIGVEDRVSSIEVGKDADFVIWNGDPFNLRSTVEATYIDGNKVYQK